MTCLTYEIDNLNKFIYFSSDVDLYNYLGENEIINHYGISLEIKRNNKYEILSTQTIDYNNKSKEEIINLLKNDIKKYDIFKPDYNTSSLNILSSIKNNFGYDYKYNLINGLFDKKYKNVVLLLLDGLGYYVMNEILDKDSFLYSHLFTTLNCVFPSTTAASTTSIISGLTPLESGWTGWENYIKEINRNIILFTGENYYTKEQTGLSGYNLMKYDPFFKDMNDVNSKIISEFGGEKNIKSVLNKSLKSFNGNENFQYVYFYDPDSTMHKYGINSIETKEVIKTIDKNVESYASKLPNDTLLIITADHGHINTNMINLYHNKRIMSLLERAPSNDSRCLTFKVKDDNKKEFEKMFNLFYGEIYDLYKSKDIYQFFGNTSKMNDRCIDFLADYVAIGKSNYYFNYSNSNHVFKSHHAGYTKNEMIVPIIVVRK